ncbi:hypothetical protein BGZ49_009305, partial [Haplosporangium sp. Z 27]
LSLPELVDLATGQIDGARQAERDRKIALQLSDQKKANRQAKKLLKKKEKLTEKALKSIQDAKTIFNKEKEDNKDHSADQSAIGAVLHSYSLLLEDFEKHEVARQYHEEAETQWGYIHITSKEALGGATGRYSCPLASVDTPARPDKVISSGDSGNSGSPKYIFSNNDVTPVDKLPFPKVDARLDSTTQLTYCLGLLNSKDAFASDLDKGELEWAETTVKGGHEMERLQTLARDIVKAYKNDDLKSKDCITEVVCLAPVLDESDFRNLFESLVSGIRDSALTNVELLEGLERLIRNSPSDRFDADDLEKVLELLNDRLNKIAGQSDFKPRFAATISRVLDSMVDCGIAGLSRENLHQPLLDRLKGMKGNSDPYLMFQASYAYQALLHVPNDESRTDAIMRKSGKILKGIFGLAAAVKSVDVNSFIDGLQNIQAGLEGLGAVIAIASDVYDNIQSLQESGASLREALEQGLTFDQKSVWYPALRGLDSLIQDGRFVDFEKVVRDSPCRRNPAFQWGVCQRLGEIVDSSLWNLDTRKCAIDFLLEIYEDDATWGSYVPTKQGVLRIIAKYQDSTTKTDISEYVNARMPVLRANGDAKKQKFFNEQTKGHTRSYPLLVNYPPKLFPLLNHVQAKPDVEAAIRRLKRERLEDRSDDIYISPRARVSLQATEDFDLMTNVQEFLLSDKKVYLLRGGSGSGKSVFNRNLEIKLWEEYIPGGPIPLFIHLPSIDSPDQDLIKKRLVRVDFTENVILELKQQRRKFVVICDGYDESELTANLYDTNQLNQAGEWQGQVVVSCRTEYLDSKTFMPKESSTKISSLFQEAVVAPFNDAQIQEYITQFTSKTKEKLDWEPHVFGKAFKDIPNLQDLAKNPFVLKLSMEVLPQLVDKDKDLSDNHVTRVELLDEFVSKWLERSRTRLQNAKLSPSDTKVFKELVDGGAFNENSILYMMRLAVAIFDNHKGNSVVKYMPFADKKTWKKEYFNKTNVMQQAIPLTKSGNEYQFIHRAYLEYGLSLAIFNPENHPESSELEQELLDSPLGRIYLMENALTRDCLDFLVERAQRHEYFKEHLRAIVERSKTDKNVSIAAANAITILVKAGVSFSGADLQKIQISRADLSYGVFDSAKLDGADLQKVNLRNIWLRGASLVGANIKEAQFGEFPYIQEPTQVINCVFSPDGKRFAVVLINGVINVYDMLSWTMIQTINRNKAEISAIVFSPNGDQIAIAEDQTVYLFDVNSGTSIRNYEGHSDKVTSIAFSPLGNWVASGSSDKTVKLWDIESDKPIYSFEGHTEDITAIAYSLNGEQIASASEDSTIRVWSVKDRTCVKVFEDDTPDVVTNIIYSPVGNQIASINSDETVQLWNIGSENIGSENIGSDKPFQTLDHHNTTINQITYSRDGARIASASDDGYVRVWDVKTGTCIHTLEGHVGSVACVMYSPTGDQLASGGSDKSVRIWENESGKCISVLQGHTYDIISVVYSPKGDRIASCNSGNLVRLWNVATGLSTHVSNGHKDEVQAVAFSPKKGQIASGSKDNTVKIWDAKSGNCIRTLTGHRERISSVIYSPNETLIASASYDDTVRLWSVANGDCIQVLKEHDDRITCIAFSPDGNTLASGSLDKTVRLWNVETGECLKVLSEEEGQYTGVACIAFSPLGHRIASSNDDDLVRLWDIETGACVKKLDGNVKVAISLAFSPNGDKLVSGGEDATVHVWDVESGDEFRIFKDHSDIVNVVAFSPKGDKVASASKDKTVRLWSVGGDKCIKTLEGHTDSVTSAVFSPDGKWLMTGSDDGSFRVWNTETGESKINVSAWNGKVGCLALKEELGFLYLVAGGADGSVRQWKIVKDEVELVWSSSHEVINLSGASFANVADIPDLDRKLLSQRGAFL